MLVELVQHNLRLRAALELDDDAHAVAIALVAHVADVVDDFVGDQLGDALDELGLVDLVGDLGDDDRLFFLGDALQAGLGAHQEAAAAGAIGVDQSFPAVEEAAGGEIRPLDVLQHFHQAGAGIVDQLDGGVDDLSEVVRGNVGGHADGDAVGPVDDERGNARGQHGGLVGGLVEVGHHIDGFHVDIGHHGFGDALHAALGVPVGGGRIAIDGAEVALAVYEGITQRPRLGHAHQGVIDRRVAVGMVLFEALAHHAGALGVALVVLQAFAVHGGENAPMDGLEAVAGVRQRAPDDNAHRISEIGVTHLLFDVDGNVAGIAGRRTAVERELGVLIVCHRCL